MPADDRREIEAAMDRLLNGTPLRSDGKLTIVSLAAEADVKRHVLTHRHTDLKDLFNARVRAQDSVPASETVLRQQNTELLRKLDDMRAERDEYKQAADALARALNVLTAENEELRRRADRAREFTGPRPLAQLRSPARCWPNPDSDGLTSLVESSIHRRSHSAIKPTGRDICGEITARPAKCLRRAALSQHG